MKTPDSGCATFYHPLFQRGRPKLLSQIKRSTHYGAAGPDRGEVQALKCEIADLKSQVNDVNDKVCIVCVLCVWYMLLKHNTTLHVD